MRGGKKHMFKSKSMAVEKSIWRIAKIPFINFHNLPISTDSIYHRSWNRKEMWRFRHREWSPTSWGELPWPLAYGSPIWKNPAWVFCPEVLDGIVESSSIVVSTKKGVHDVRNAPPKLFLMVKKKFTVCSEEPNSEHTFSCQIFTSESFEFKYEKPGFALETECNSKMSCKFLFGRPNANILRRALNRRGALGKPCVKYYLARGNLSATFVEGENNSLCSGWLCWRAWMVFIYVVLVQGTRQIFVSFSGSSEKSWAPQTVH